MARLNQTRVPTTYANGSASIESVVETLRAVWDAIDRAESSDRAKLIKNLTQTVSRLKNRIEKHLGKPLPASKNRTLFDLSEVQKPPKSKAAAPSLSPRFSEPSLRIYDKDVAVHALQHLPDAAKCRTVEDFRTYLSEKIRFNSQATRRRTANYIVSRFFPGDIYNDDLPQFAAATAGKSSLGEALFYLTCKTEKVVSLVAEEIVFPSLAQGGVSRTRLREYIKSTFPLSKSVEAIGQSIVRTYHLYGIGTPDRTRLNVSLREGSLASFAYILHLEFPDPGMHAFEKMFDGPMHKWLLWDQQWMVSQLYRLREVGLLSKVSEIDRMRQFTTKFSLADAMQRIVALAKESPQ